MKTLLVPQVALATLALLPTLLGQDAGSHAGVVEFTRPHAAPRVRQALADETPKLGVMISETDDGLLISDVFEGSLAESAGLANGDILFKIGGRRVNDLGDIPASLRHIAPGDTVDITVIRAGEGLVTLEGQRPAADAPDRQGGEAPADARGFLGVELGEGSDGGVTIERVLSDTAAWFAGLQDGDLVVSVNGEAVSSAEALSEALGSVPAGELAALVWTRDGQQQQADVRLGHRSPTLLDPQGNLGLLRAMPGRRQFRFGPGPGGLLGPHQGQGRLFFGDDDEDNDWHEFSEGIENWADDFGHKLQLRLHGQGRQGLEALEKLGLEHLLDGDTRRLEIKIEDGVMTIERDGETEVIELDGDADALHEIRLKLDAGQCDASPLECDDASAPECAAAEGSGASKPSCCDKADKADESDEVIEEVETQGDDALH